MSILSFLGLGNNKIKDALLRGALIIDVRSAGEYDQGKIPGSGPLTLAVRGLDHH